jgi:hypothetical protein
MSGNTIAVIVVGSLAEGPVEADRGDRLSQVFTLQSVARHGPFHANFPANPHPGTDLDVLAQTGRGQRADKIRRVVKTQHLVAPAPGDERLVLTAGRHEELDSGAAGEHVGVTGQGE